METLETLAQLKLLIQLAQIDGKVAERERNYIINIGRANGIYPDEVVPLFSIAHTITVPKNLADNEKFEYIYSLVMLMKIDERMYQEEIKFCSEVASRLGYDQEVMFDLLLRVKSSNMSENEKRSLKSITDKFLKP
jgi:uncharacterized tellurite resistance protein B-like protein